MICRDGKWVAEPQPPAGAPQKKKRRVTPAMRSANKRNAQASTGPRSAQGLEKASLNATTHGATCTKLIFLPGESPDEFEAEVDVWARRLGARTEPERAQVETAVYCEWKARRAENASAYAVKKKIDGINDQFASEKARETWALIPELAAKPKETVQKLMESTFGCAWLIQQFTLVREWLVSYSSLEVSRRAYVLNLGGHDPRDLFSDPVVMEFNRAYFGGISGNGAAGFTAAEAANALMKDRPAGMSYPELERQMVRHVIDLPTIEQGKAMLQKYVEDSIARISRWKGLIELREQRDKTTEIGMAQSLVTPEGSKWQGYAATNKRIHFASLRTLFAIQHERRKYGEGDLSGLDREEGKAAVVPAESGEPQDVGPQPIGGEGGALDATVAEGPELGEAPAVKNQNENGAVVTQVVGGAGGNNAPAAPSGVDAAGAFEFSAEEIAAAVAWGRQRTEAILREEP